MTAIQTQTYNPTFLQKLLGRNYKWWYTVIFYIKSYGSGISGFLVSQISDIIQTLAIVYIWVINSSPSGVITYLVVGRIFKALSDCFVSEEVSPLILNGTISNYLLLPSNFFNIIFFKEIGRRLVFNLARAFSFFVIILLYFQLIDFKFFTFTNFLLTLPLLVISFMSSFYLEFMIGFGISFFDKKRNYSGFKRAYNGIATTLSGLIIPLDKLPLYKEILQFLPTSWSLHHPMQIYLGKYTPLETFYVFLGGITWCITLYFLAKWVFKMGLKKNEAVGL